MRYIVGRYYKSDRGEYQAGQVIVIDDPEYAAWLARDMRGFLEPVMETPPAAPPAIDSAANRAMEAPPADRMVRKSRKRSAMSNS